MKGVRRILWIRVGFWEAEGSVQFEVESKSCIKAKTTRGETAVNLALHPVLPRD